MLCMEHSLSWLVPMCVNLSHLLVREIKAILVVTCFQGISVCSCPMTMYTHEVKYNSKFMLPYHTVSHAVRFDTYWFLFKFEYHC